MDCKDMIEIKYKRCSEINPRTMRLTPEQYFDPIYKNETFENDGIPKHNHAYEYLNTPRRDLDWTKLIYSDPHRSYITTTQYSGSDTIMIWHRVNKDGYEEICIETKISPDSWHITRINKNEGEDWRINYIGIIRGIDGQPQSEQKIFPNQ